MSYIPQTGTIVSETVSVFTYFLFTSEVNKGRQACVERVGYPSFPS